MDWSDPVISFGVASLYGWCFALPFMLIFALYDKDWSLVWAWLGGALGILLVTVVVYYVS